MIRMMRADWKALQRRKAELMRGGALDAESAHRQALAEIEAAKLAKAESNAAKRASREARALHCQICGRPILAETGHIAHHGYTRPGDGWQTDSCPGAQRLPYEASRDVLGQYIAGLHSAAQSAATALAAVLNESAPVMHTWQEYSPAHGRSIAKHVSFTRETLDAVRVSTPHAFRIFGHGAEFVFFKARDVAAREARIAGLESEIKSQQKRFDEWRQTRDWRGQWVPVETAGAG